MFECRIQENEYPKVGEIVLAKTSSTENDILNMQLVEYGGISGLVLSSELSKKRVRSIHQITKVGSTEVCQVLGVDPVHKYIDLSLKSVGEKEKRECHENASKNKLSYQIMLKAAKEADISVSELYEREGYRRMGENGGSLYKYFVRAKNNPKLLQESEHGQYFAKVIEEQFTAASHKARADVDVFSFSGGVQAVIDSLKAAVRAIPGLEISLLRTPTYSLSKIAGTKEQGFEDLERACAIIKEEIESRGGNFAVSSPPKLYGEKGKHLLFEDGGDDEAKASSDEMNE